jgi:membrane protein implicated in regulation of membrane protease activity
MFNRIFLFACALLAFNQGVANGRSFNWGRVASDSGSFANYLIVILVIFAILSLVLTVVMGLQSHKRPLVSGRELLVGQSEAISIDEHGHYWLMLEGERWQCIADQPLVSGQRVKVTAVQGLKLKVIPQE